MVKTFFSTESRDDESPIKRKSPRRKVYGNSGVANRTTSSVSWTDSNGDAFDRFTLTTEYEPTGEEPFKIISSVTTREVKPPKAKLFEAEYEIGDVVIVLADPSESKRGFWIAKVIGVSFRSLSVQWYGARRPTGPYRLTQLKNSIEKETVMIRYSSLPRNRYLSQKMKQAIEECMEASALYLMDENIPLLRGFGIKANKH